MEMRGWQIDSIVSRGMTIAFFLPIIGIIAAEVYKHKQYYHNYKACKKGAVIGFIVLGVILLIFLLALLLVVIR